MSTVADTPSALPATDIPVEPFAAADAPAPIAEPVAEAPKTEDAAVPVEESTAVPAVATEENKEAEKVAEPISEGQLAYKGPGLVKSLIPSKREFWLNDEAVAPANLDLYLRGEKPEIAHPVVGWASQTGKGLLFSVKKNADKTHPSDVLALYDATDLKKSSPHEFSFKLNGHNHTFKAASDVERDGWYVTIEKAIELSKASKEETQTSESYKSEIEKLSKPAAVVTADRAGSVEEEDAQKKQKSRSTSRGMLNRFKAKKDEVEQKAAEKKEEKEAEKEEKKAEEAEPVSATTDAAPVVAAVSTADIPTASETTETKPVEESTPVVEDKPKPNKRASIFGKAPWSSMRSPAKEKDLKEAELKTDAPKDAVVSENPPQLPETTTEGTEIVVPAVQEPAAEASKDEVLTPSKEKSNFLSGLGFMKRNRSVSPSTAMKEQPKKEETATEETPAVVDPVEPVVESAAIEPLAETEETPVTNKRQSMLGSLGRRASKALRGIQTPAKKENAAPATEPTTEVEEPKTEETPAVNGETKAAETEEAQKSIGDVVPDAVNVGQPQTTAPVVTASA